ncbi:hypothetical protein K449DRAFT_397125 [Hypoxylon sp. EC38]|nr:hypothetical protein K449DRAFT_397125 [Hypoxylon sp. EC38]
MSRRNEFTGYTPQPPNPGAQPHPSHGQQHHQQIPQQHQHQNQPHQQSHGSHPQHPHHQPHQTAHQGQQHHATPVPPPMTLPQQPVAPSQQSTPTPAPAPAPRGRKRPAPGHQQQPHQQAHQPPHAPTANPATPGPVATTAAAPAATTPAPAPAPTPVSAPAPMQVTPVAPPAVPTKEENTTPAVPPPAKKSRTNTPWTPAEELRLKQMRDAGNSWAEIAKTFPTRTEGSVKKHWYKDMHYAEFAEDESQALLSAIKDYENNKWKTIGQKVGKPAKACEQYAKEHFPELFSTQKARVTFRSECPISGVGTPSHASICSFLPGIVREQAL